MPEQLGGSRTDHTLGARHRSLRDLIVEQLVAEIVSGVLSPGEHLREAELAERLGTSRNPVREALRDLVASGLIEIAPRRGAQVANIDRDDLISVLEVRALLEAHAVRLAAERRTSRHLADLDRAVADGSAAADRGDLQAANDAHHRFLDVLDQAAGNRHLVAALQILRARSHVIYAVLSPTSADISWCEHERMVDAIRSRDPSAAEAATREHLASLAQRLRRSDE